MTEGSTLDQLDAPESSWRPFAPFFLSYQTIAGLAGLSEGLLILAASILGQGIYQSFSPRADGALEVAIGTGLTAALIYLSFAHATDLYRLPQLLCPERNFGKIALVWGFGLLMLIAILFLLKVGSDLSRGAFLIFAALELPMLLGARLVAARAFRSKIARDAIAGRRAVVIGDLNELGELSSANLLHEFGFKEIGRVALAAPEALEGGGVSRRLALEEAMNLARRSQAEEFVLAIGWNQSGLLDEISDILRNSPLPVRLLPDRVVRAAMGGRRIDSSICSSITVEMQRAPMTILERGVKRLVDIALASAAILLLMPTFLISAVAIKLDSHGPVIFRQRRNGFNQRQFGIYKFRTMQVLEDGNTITQATRQDPRVTRVGRFLRRASIDELPQLFNVLKGDMSLVGPRPHALAHDDQYKQLIETYCFRHNVKPGITGWAQVHGLRGETAQLARMQKRVEFDLWYINNWSLWLDIQILLRTCFEVLRQEAY